MKIIVKPAVVLMSIIIAVLTTIGSANATNAESAMGGFCDGPDTRVCKITSQGTTVYGDWVEEQIQQ